MAFKKQKGEKIWNYVWGVQNEIKDTLSTKFTNFSQVLPHFLQMSSKIILYLHFLVLFLGSLYLTNFMSKDEGSSSTMNYESIIPFY